MVKKIFCLQILVLLFLNALAQHEAHKKFEEELTQVSSKIFPFYYGNQDSLEFYSTLFSDMLITYIQKNPSTLNHSFKSLIDSNVCDIVTSADGLFRIYTWDTWLGGTMHDFNGIYQYRAGKKVYTKNLKLEDDPACYYSDIYTLKTTARTYYLGINNASYSTRDVNQGIKIFTIEGSKLNDTVKLIKTASGFTNQIDVNFDFFSVADKDERPIRIIKYDADKRTIYIPVVYEDGKVTNKFMLYQFNGSYFERVLTQKKGRSKN